MGLADGKILGVTVGSTAPVFLAVLAVHVAAALTAVISGAVAAVSAKGGDRHVRAGRIYFRALAAVFGTALVLAGIRLRHDWYLALIGAVAFAAAILGVRHRRLRRNGDTGHIVPMGVSYAAMFTAFYVDNGPHLPLWDRLPTVVFYFLPAVVAAPLVGRAVLRHRRPTD
jgi:uncharacterized membrane protein